MVTLGRMQLVREVANKTGHSQKDVADVLEAILGVTTDTISNGGEIKIPGYWHMGSKMRSARAGRNPRTGETIQIAAKRIAFMRAGKAIKDAADEANG